MLHRYKKHWEEVTPSLSGAAQEERGYPRGRKHTRDLLQIQGRGNAIGAGALGTAGGNAGTVGLAPGTCAKGKRIAHEGTKLLVFLLVCLFLLLLLISESLCLWAAAESPSSRGALLVLVGEFTLGTMGHGLRRLCSQLSHLLKLHGALACLVQ